MTKDKNVVLHKHYIDQVKSNKEYHEQEYKETLKEVFNKEISWERFKQSDINQKRETLFTLMRKIRLKESNLDPMKLAKAIQNSRSGIGGCAMTPFTCKFCNKEEVWTSTAVPHICSTCATDMATKMILQQSDIYK